MKRDDIIDVFSEFLRDNYYKELAMAVNEGKKALEIDFSLLDRFNPQLADLVLEKPEDTIPVLEEAVERIDLPQMSKLHIRFINLPESSQIRIRNIRAEHIGKLLCVDGIVKRASEVRPEVAEITFECQECGNRITIIQTERDKTVRYPARCECGNRRSFRIVKERLYDARWISIEEPFEITTGERPSSIMVYLKEDLVSPRMRNKTEPGNRIRVVGILKEVPRKTIKGRKSRQMDILLDANNVEAVETEWEELIITPEDEKLIRKLAKDKHIYDKLVASLAPTMYGLDKIKLAIILQLFGGVPHILKDGTRIRGDIHLLLVGDPATGKCIHGDTYITLKDGSIKKIRDIVESGLKKTHINRMSDGYFGFTNHDIFSMDSNLKIVPSKSTVLWKRTSTDYLCEVETESGTKIKVTPSHVFFCLNDGSVVEKRAEDLTPNDRIATAKYLPIEGTRLMMNIQDKGEGSNSGLPRRITPEFCRFVGYMLSGARVHAKDGLITLNFRSKDKNLLEDFHRCAGRLFGDNVRRTEGGKPSEYLCAREVMKFLHGLEPSLLAGPQERRIPDVLLQTQNKNLKHLLMAMFDAGASIDEERVCMSISLRSEELVHQVRLVLLRFGIGSRLYSGVGKNRGEKSYQLEITGRELAKYYGIIGFVSRANGEKCKKLLGSCTSENKILNIDEIRWDRVVRVEKVRNDSEYVYDLQVEPHHNFVAEDVIVHNSQILKLASQLIPRGKYVSGKGTTAAGLTASVVKDVEFLGGWVLEAGALVLANNSLIGIDEFEKMSKEDQVAMHEALSLQQVSIAKASIVATLPARTAVLAGANPKLGRFDPYIPIREQIDIPETLLSRFDVKFALRDVPNVELDEKMVDHVLRARHFEPQETKPPIPPELLRKYIAYARINCKPVLTEEAGKRLKEFYVSLRAKTAGEEAPVPITLRQYEALIRLAEASARVQLQDKVRVEDAERAIEIMKHSLRQFGFDPETGMIDIDRAEGITTSAQRSKIRTVLDILEELHETIGKTIPVDEVIKRAKEQGVMNVEDILRRMKSEGMIFEPKPHFIQKV